MAGSIKLTDFKSQLRDAARPNRFWVTIGNHAGDNTTGAGSMAWSDQMPFLAKTTSLPNRTIGNIELNWQGMKAKIAGDPTFDDITFTFINDYDWNVKNFMETWLEQIAAMDGNTRTAHESYKVDVTLEQLGRDGETISKYILIGAYPISMDSIELSQESSDTVEEVTVSLTYDFFKREDVSGISTNV